MERELAWAAGFFDGEGSTSVHKVKKYAYPKMAIWQKDRRPLDRFLAAVGAGRIYGPYPKSGDQYLWAIEGAQATTVIERLWDYLSEPKQEQITRVQEALV